MRISFRKLLGSVALLLVVIGWFTFASATGSGSITAAKRLGISSAFADNPVAGVKGLGQIQAACTGPQLAIRYLNSSTKSILLAGEFDGNKLTNELAPGSDDTQEVTFPGVSTYELHVTQESSSRKPQAFVAISAVNTSDCAHVMVSALVTRP
jgi:hypothetical protein